MGSEMCIRDRIAGMYAVYHGPTGLTRIAHRIHMLTSVLAEGLAQHNLEIVNQSWFDTLTVKTGANTQSILDSALAAEINLRTIDEGHIGLSIDEATSAEDIVGLWDLLLGEHTLCVHKLSQQCVQNLPGNLMRTDDFLTHETFNRYHSETEMLRYIRKLSDKDIALDRSMIPLGSCTMKLNATSEMLPITWPQFANIHPFAPSEQTQGYQVLISQLEAMLCKVTGYDAISLQPNAGSQGEYAGLLAIRAYHRDRGDLERTVCLIPSSAHGTNPASAQMCGMQVIVVDCDEQGNIDLEDLQKKAVAHSENLAAIMVTYPSTHGVFEEHIVKVCEIVHDNLSLIHI